jgi:DNA-binding transcriptional ArsR family regulator
VDRLNGLQFACECVSSSCGGYSEPWAGIAKHKLLPNGTKEQILNILAQEPKTLSQIAAALRLAPPTLHVHVREMLSSELLRESTEWEKIHPAEVLQAKRFRLHQNLVRRHDAKNGPRPICE